LVLPFEEVRENDLQPLLDLMLVAPAHALDLIDQVLQVEIVPAPCAQEPRLLLRPIVGIGLVQIVSRRRRLAHVRLSRCPARP
jgi:hypothetical protein